MATYQRIYGDIKIRTDQQEHYHERGQRAADESVVLTVYVPAPGSYLEHTLLPGSAIVGSSGLEAWEGRIVIHYEGARYQNMHLEERFLHAASRHVCRYPTVAYAVVDPGVLTEVGTYDVANQRLDITDHDALERWTATDSRLTS